MGRPVKTCIGHAIFVVERIVCKFAYRVNAIYRDCY